ncbi:transglycosylase domain-containing protein [Paenibacillus sp. N1-5-1-14]|uniref:transglycosylase domain-containing protein n=1 Tax=Paenibacillus radicibacter TaxID=2972488 RepID=UPI00215925A9|nr:transglycosylase domain-containing protein [Paenibacillus radicibacter]MCR8641760.1 transglycosylase domain-containing protein [Paenibacillus radicibacter]
MGKITNFFNKPGVRKTGKWTFISLKWLIVAIIAVGILGGSAAFGLVSALVKDDPIRSKEFMLKEMEQNVMTGFVHFNNGDTIGQMRSEEDRRMIKLNEIPQVVVDAVLSIEDKDFYNHFGIDMNGLLRAVKQKVLNEDVQTGGSTITQQLARRVFLTLDKENDRKAKELLLALRMDRLLSKDEILLAYLNKIPYGNGSSGYNLYGIKAAAKGIFNENDLNKLSIAQVAYLAGLPQLPSNFSAFTGEGKFDGAAFKRATDRQRLVLKRMLEENKISQDQYQTALNFDLKASLAESTEKAYNTYPYLMLEAEKQATEILLKQKYPELDPTKNAKEYNAAKEKTQKELLHGGYHIYTTIDKTIYDAMHEISENDKNFSPDDKVKGKEQVGAVMVDSKTGAILGMIEGRGFSTKEQYNHATQAFRQPGSTMKPLAAYIPAMEKGLIQPGSIIDDVPLILKDGQKGFHIPDNHDHKFHGLITARTALDQSYNIPALKVFLDMVTIDEAWSFVKKLGVTSITKEDYAAQTGVIGGLSKGVSVKEFTGAFASISNRGVYNESHMISKITDTDGKIIYQYEQKPTTVFSEETAYLITDMMRTVVTQGTGGTVSKNYKYAKKTPIVGKTGSTQDDGDVWFMGYSPDITLGVWVGYDKPIYKLEKKTGGTQRANTIWAMVMNSIVEKKPELFPTKEFKKPNNIVSATVSSVSGKLPSELTTAANLSVTDIFNRKYLPTEVDNVMTKMKISTYNSINYVANEATPADFVQEKTVVKREKPMSQILKELEEVLPKIRDTNKRSIDYYKTTDYDTDAPSDPDPRVDDGKNPAPPTSVVATKSGETATISFQPSASPDLVGYRIYRSENGGPFQILNGKVILAGAEAKYTETVHPDKVYKYYLVAVDVVGKTSVPSNASASDGSFIDPIYDPQLPPNIGGGPTDPSQPGGNTTNPSSSTPPSAPHGVNIKREGIALKVSWNANDTQDKVKSYSIYYSDKENGIYKKIGSSPGTTNEFNYFDVSYKGYYKVTAVNEAGESKPSAPFIFKD